MKDYQFEEITFWFSLIACLLAYHFNIIWMQYSFSGMRV